MRRSLFRAALTASCVALIALTGGVAAGSAQAATGVVGGFTSARIDTTAATCVPESTTCNSAPTYALGSGSGWAYNARTRPVQEVYVSYSEGTGRFRATFKSPVRVASKTRNDIKKAHHLPTAKVGFSFSFEFNGPIQHGTRYTICLHARDHGTKQAWRTLQCVHRSR